MHTEASLNYILGSISECSARALAKHLSNRRSTYAIICNMPTSSHTFLASLHEGFSDLPKHKRVSGHPQLLLQSLLRVSVRPTTSFYRGFQCDPQLPFISLFFTALCSCKSLSHNHRSPCKSHKQSLRSTCKSQALWHIEAASTSPVSQALALNSDIS